MQSLNMSEHQQDPADPINRIPQCPVFQAKTLEEFRDFQGFLEKCV